MEVVDPSRKLRVGRTTRKERTLPRFRVDRDRLLSARRAASSQAGATEPSSRGDPDLTNPPTPLGGGGGFLKGNESWVLAARPPEADWPEVRSLASSRSRSHVAQSTYRSRAPGGLRWGFWHPRLGQ